MLLTCAALRVQLPCGSSSSLDDKSSSAWLPLSKVCGGSVGCDLDASSVDHGTTSGLTCWCTLSHSCYSPLPGMRNHKKRFQEPEPVTYAGRHGHINRAACGPHAFAAGAASETLPPPASDQASASSVHGHGLLDTLPTGK